MSIIIWRSLQPCWIIIHPLSVSSSNLVAQSLFASSIWVAFSHSAEWPSPSIIYTSILRFRHQSLSEDLLIHQHLFVLLYFRCTYKHHTRTYLTQSGHWWEVHAYCQSVLSTAFRSISTSLVTQYVVTWPMIKSFSHCRPMSIAFNVRFWFHLSQSSALTHSQQGQFKNSMFSLILMKTFLCSNVYVEHQYKTVLIYTIWIREVRTRTNHKYTLVSRYKLSRS